MASSFSPRWWRILGLYSLAIATPFCAHVREDDQFERVYLYYKLGDYNLAKKECDRAVKLYPKSEKLQELNFRIAAEKGDIGEAIAFIKQNSSFSKVSNFNDLSLLESLAWGVLTNVSGGSESMQLMSMVGAFFTRDARAVNLIMSHLNSRNALLRAHAVRAVSMYRDSVLQDRLKVMLSEEKNYFVRLEVLRSVGALRMKNSVEMLKEIVSSDRSTDEEKYYALGALIQIYDDLQDDEFEEMVRSPRAGFRRIAVDIATHLGQKERIESIYKMRNDSSPEVKLSVLNALVFLGIENLDRDDVRRWLTEWIDSTNPAFSLSGEWAGIRLGLSCPKTKVMEWLYHKNPKWRLMAASVLSYCGAASESELSVHIHKHFDPFVRLELAKGLIHLGKHLDIALHEIESVLANSQVKLMKCGHPNRVFTSVCPSEVRHVPLMPQYPDMVDQVVRLELINTLTIFDYAGAKERLKEMMKNHSLNVVGNTASLLLEQGDLESIELVRELLDDSDPGVATQAALVLAFLGKDPTVVPTLTKAYATANWDLKIQILEALGKIGEHEAIPFLIETIEEPFQLLKIIAASSIIQCLYH